MRTIQSVSAIFIVFHGAVFFFFFSKGCRVTDSSKEDVRDEVLDKQLQHFLVPVGQLMNQSVDGTHPVVLVV